MKKILCAALACLSLAGIANAAPGDTTWVQAQNNIQLTAYGAFDAPVVFPSGANSYRKIYMVFTMGEYVCPGSPQYCHQWDYDVHNIIMTPAGDTMEISRFITPYATSGVPRFPSTWSHRYIFDVTDYYPLLKNNAALRIFYSGYSYGFTANVRFAFIEGIPERNVMGISKIWNGGYPYGNAANPIENNVAQVSRTAPAGAQSAELKFTVTGHGADANQCCEFASHNYQVKVNGGSIATKAIWRSDCGENELYPQGGTWIFERGNWCPGAIVNVNTHKLTGVSGGNNYTLDVDFDPYTVASNFGSYNVTGNVIYYGAYNKTTDASVEDIIAPTDFEGHFRENPCDGKPVVTIRNTGATAITSMRIRYGVKDSVAASYDWSGSLLPSAETQITLPELATLKTMSLNSVSGTFQFQAQIVNVNGAADNYAQNDTLRSFFTVAPTWPNTFIVYMKTNSAGVSGVGQNPSETSWKITDASGNIVASRTNANISTTYNDTVSLPQTGFYKLTITDQGCDGLHWWLWDANPGQGITGGNLVVRDYSMGLPIPMKNYSYTSSNYHDDFGCSYTQNFTTAGYPAGVHTAGHQTSSIVAYPNPARNSINVALRGAGTISGEIRMIDALGQVVHVQKATTSETLIDVSRLAPGIYNVIYTDKDNVRTATRVTLVK